MRAGLSTIQQTLTPEAASILNQSIGEASRRSHGQTTPLHVAATLLASPSGSLRQACIRSHPNSSHPLRSRALELCFSVALDRLPSGNGPPNSEPPISNALLAALKRAQAHQRKGCPEQQQQPFLAVKVELEQLIVSILDDPSVSRVMKEAKFSSPAVKAAIEQSIASTSPSSLSVPSPTTTSSSSAVGLVLRPMTPAPNHLPANRNLYLNPKLQQLQQSNQKQQHHQQRIEEEEVRTVLDVFARDRKRNPVLVGDTDPEALLKEALQKIVNKDIPDHSVLKNVHLLNLDWEFGSGKPQISSKIAELANSIETRIRASGNDGWGGVIVNLGDLKWLVENPNGMIVQIQQLVSEIGRTVVTEIGKILARFNKEGGGGGGGCRVWVTGTASCATYLRCQVYHPNMEKDWDIQAVPIAPRTQANGVLLRKGGNGILSASIESLASHRGLVPTAAAPSDPLLSRRSLEITDPVRRSIMCPACTKNYEQEAVKLGREDFEKACSYSKPEVKQSLPPWLEAAKLTTALQKREQDLKSGENSEKLLKRWQETCLRVHPSFHTPAITVSDRPPLGAAPLVHNLYNPKLLLPKPYQPKKLPPVESLFNPPLQVLNTRSSGPTVVVPKPHVFPPGSLVGTALALGRPTAARSSDVEQCHRDRVTDLSGSTPDFFPNQHQQPDTIGEIDSFKRLFKGLTEKISWQPDAASAVAVTVTQCRSGQGKRSLRRKSDVWLLFLGPDKVGKKKMASALSELLFGMSPTTVSFGCNRRVDFEDGGSNPAFRRKTALDWISEAVRRNPFSVFVIEDIDQADAFVQSKIKQAIESGRLLDSNGREASLGSAIFIMTADNLPDVLQNSSVDSLLQCEQKLESVSNCSWQLELLVGEKPMKRRNEWLGDEVDRYTKLKTLKPDGSGLSLDLNLCTSGIEDDNGEGSRNSSDLTVEHEVMHEHRMLINPPPLSSSTQLTTDLINAVDHAIVFKPVDFEPIRAKVSNSVIQKFNSILGSRSRSQQQLKIDPEALETIVSGIWFGCMDSIMFEDWLEKVLVPCFSQLKNNSSVSEGSVVRLIPVKEDPTTPTIYRLPTKIAIANGELHVL